MTSENKINVGISFGDKGINIHFPHDALMAGNVLRVVDDLVMSRVQMIIEQLSSDNSNGLRATVISHCMAQFGDTLREMRGEIYRLGETVIQTKAVVDSGEALHEETQLQLRTLRTDFEEMDNEHDKLREEFDTLENEHDQLQKEFEELEETQDDRYNDIRSEMLNLERSTPTESGLDRQLSRFSKTMDDRFAQTAKDILELDVKVHKRIDAAVDLTAGELALIRKKTIEIENATKRKASETNMTDEAFKNLIEVFDSASEILSRHVYTPQPKEDQSPLHDETVNTDKE